MPCSDRPVQLDLAKGMNDLAARHRDSWLPVRTAGSQNDTHFVILPTGHSASECPAPTGQSNWTSAKGMKDLAGWPRDPSLPGSAQGAHSESAQWTATGASTGSATRTRALSALTEHPSDGAICD